MRKKVNKKTKEKVIKEEKLVKEEVEVEKTDVGEVLSIIADEDNPVSDGLEFKDGGKDE